MVIYGINIVIPISAGKSKELGGGGVFMPSAVVRLCLYQQNMEHFREVAEKSGCWELPPDLPQSLQLKKMCDHTPIFSSAQCLKLTAKTQ